MQTEGHTMAAGAKPKRQRKEWRMPCDYCRSGEVFRRDQNCPRCGRQGLLPTNYDAKRKAVRS